jgi:putative sterol carrier protein
MQPTPQGTAAVAEAYFHSIEGPCRYAERFAGVHTAAFDISGVGVWYVTYKDGKCIAACFSPPPEVIYTLSAEVFLRIVDKKDPLNPVSAFLQGLLEVDGDLALARLMLNAHITG